MCFAFVSIAAVLSGGEDANNLKKTVNEAPPLQQSSFSDKLIQRQSVRAMNSNIPRLMDDLGIKPGMSILDVGAGSGQYAYLFARRLRNTGAVYATDVDPGAVEYVKKEGQRQKLLNLYSVLVTKDGVDPFYEKHRYDLIFLSHVYVYLQDRIEYLRRMRGLLTDNGRFVAVYMNGLAPFTDEDIRDIDNLVKELVQETPESPFYKYFNELRSKTVSLPFDDATKVEFRKTVREGFNKILYDPYFCKSFLVKGGALNKDVAFTEREKKSAQWLLIFFEEEGLFNKKREDFHSKEFGIVMTLNRLLIGQRFRRYLRDGEHPYLTGKDGYWQNMMKEDFKKAGYRLERQYDFAPFETAAVFVKADKE